jgi:nucleotide-binding universal stress UspA family protein
MIETFPIGVAVDGSAASMAAVRWAAVAAARRGVGLKIVHVCEVNTAYLWTVPHLPEQLKELCRPAVTQAIELARQTAPGLEVTDWVLVGNPYRMLLLASENAGLLVLGRTGRSALAAHLVGSTSYRLAAHAHCPIVALPAPDPDASGPLRPNRVVLGIADRPNQGRAIDFALDQAARHSVELLAVRAWPGPAGQHADPAAAEADQLRQVNQLLAAQLAGRSPVPAIASMVRAGPPAGVLCALCRPDDLLVLGHRRHAPFVPASIGKVGADCIHEASCPVAVVPEPALVAEHPARPRIAETAG